MILIKNGRIKTMDGPELEQGQILIENGKIKAVGVTLDAPAEAEVIDASGCLVTPGLIDGHCHIGLIEEIIGGVGSDVNEMTNPITPEMRGIDGINPMDEAFDEAVKSGVTCAVTGPGSANVVGGTFCAIKLKGKRVDDMILKDPVETSSPPSPGWRPPPCCAVCFLRQSSMRRSGRPMNLILREKQHQNSISS